MPLTTPSALLGRVRLDQPTQGSLRLRAVLSTVSVGVQGGLRFVTTAAVARLAGPEVVGALSAAIATGSLLVLLWPTSAGTAASRFVASARGAEDWDAAAGVVRFLVRRTLAASMLLALAGLVWSALAHHDVTGGVSIAAFVLGYSGYSLLRGVQFGAGQVPRAVVWDVLSVAVALALLVAALLAGVRSTALVLPIAAGYACYVVASWPRRHTGVLDRGTRREIDAFVAFGVLAAVANSGFLQMSMIAARVADTAAQAGQYAAALALATPPSLLAGALSLALFPSMAERWGRGDVEGLRTQTDQAMRLMVLLLVALFGVLAICSRLLISIVFGSRFSGAQDLLPVLLFATLALSLTVVCSNSITTRGHRGVVAVAGVNLVGLLLGLAVWALFGGTSGVTAVAAGYLCGTVLILGALVAVVWRRDHQPWWGLAVRLVAGAAVLAVLVRLVAADGVPLWVEPLVAVGYVGLWLLAAGRDRALLVTLVRRRPAA